VAPSIFNLDGLIFVTCHQICKKVAIRTEIFSTLCSSFKLIALVSTEKKHQKAKDGKVEQESEERVEHSQ